MGPGLRLGRCVAGQWIERLHDETSGSRGSKACEMAAAHHVARWSTGVLYRGSHVATGAVCRHRRAPLGNSRDGGISAAV